MSYTKEQIEQAVKSKAYKWFDGDDLLLNIVGVRTSSTGKKVTNLFDDFLTLSYKENGEWKFHVWPATTEPGKKGVMQYSNPNGVARLVPGQYSKSHVIGRHQGKYEALKQASPVKVYRDANKDMTYDENKTQEGIFGINIHKAGADSTYVENWSEGCQVFKKIVDFDEFMRVCVRASQKHGNSFTYTLIESNDIQDVQKFNPTENQQLVQTEIKNNPTTTTPVIVKDTKPTEDPNKIFLFDVQDEQSFFCLEPKMELFIIPALNTVDTVYRNQEVDEEVIDEEFIEVPILTDDLMELEGNPEIKLAIGTEIEYNEKPTDEKDNITASTSMTNPPAPSASPAPVSGEKAQTNYQNPSGVSEKDWNKNGTVVKGSKVPLSITKAPNYAQKVKLNQTMIDEYLPVIKGISGYSVGAKLLAICMAQKEGFVGGAKSTRSYRTNNPGNIGNTDNGKNKKLATLKDGILLQLDYITKVAEGQHKGYPLNQNKLMKPYYSPEIAANNKPPKGSYVGMTEYLPGYDFTYTGRIEQYCKIYATGARATNGYISMIVSWFRQNGFTEVHEETTIKELVSLNKSVPLLS